MTSRAACIIAFTVLCTLAAFLLPAMPQPPVYHAFADHRSGFGIANFLDVTSNIGFAIAGLTGLFVVMRRRTRFEFASERWPYGVFFLGLLLTAAGSVHYHLDPDNERLFLDRLPMMIAFMSLLVSQVVDRISVRVGLALLVPMLLVGIASVVYWIATERAGAGNLMPYVVLQVYSVVMLLALALLYPSRYTRGGDVYWVFAAYAIAKLLELFDHEVLALGNLVSGHSLKHLLAAVAGLIICRMLWLRVPNGRALHDLRAAGTTVRVEAP
jgi:hypothetical protein